MSDQRVDALIEQAFEYRGYVTVSRRDGSSIVGFVYDRSSAHVEMFDEHALQRIRVGTDDITDVALTGDDSAAAAQRRWERRKGTLEARTTSAWGDWGQRPILIAVALQSDLRAVARVLGAEIRGSAVRRRLGDAVAVARNIGVGGGATHAIAGEHPRLVISCGFSGALDESLRTGDLVLASSVHDETGDHIAAPDHILRITRRALEGVGRLSEGEILCASHVATTPDEKHGLARPGRLAVDLESWAVARAAERAGIPWLALRVVLDPLDMELPAFTKQVRASYVSAALRHALHGPRSMLQLARLAARADTATRSLERALRHLVPVLGGVGLAQEHA